MVVQHVQKAQLMLEHLNVVHAQLENSSIPPLGIVLIVILLVKPVKLILPVLLQVVHYVKLLLQSTKVMVLVVPVLVLVLVVQLMVVDLI